MVPSLAGSIETVKLVDPSTLQPQKTDPAPETENTNPESFQIIISGNDILLTPEPESGEEGDTYTSSPEEIIPITSDQAIGLIPESAFSPKNDSASSPPTTQESESETDYKVYEELIADEYKSLPHYYSKKAKRYVEYGALYPDLGFETAILHVNIGIDKPFYSIINIITDPDRLDILVNKYNKLPDSHKPKLEKIPAELYSKGVASQYLRADAKEAFEKMHRDAKELGLNITAYSTYRSIQLQKDIWNTKVNSGRSIEDVDSLNSRGGHSEHHTGLTIDVIKSSYSTENTKEFTWYKDNAHKYGFIIRYPKGKEHITGYKYEPWHLRYLGEELAAAVYESGLCYEEYYAMYIEPGVN